MSKVLMSLPVGERVGIAFSGGLDTSAAVVAELPSIQASLPDGMTIKLVYDSTETISASIVRHTPYAIARRLARRAVPGCIQVPSTRRRS